MFEIIFFSIIAFTASGLIAYMLKKNPQKAGLTHPVPGKYYLLCIVPFAVCAFIVLQNRVEGISYPTGIAVNGHVVLVTGTIETVREDQVTEVAYSQYKTKSFLYDASTGKAIKSFEQVTPLYIQRNKVLATGPFGYHVIELATGSETEVLSEGEIRERFARFTPDKIYSIELDKTGPFFNVRTVLDKNITYDPILDQVEVKEGVRLFLYPGARQAVSGTSLFKPEAIAKTSDGNTLAVSYDDLEKKSFLISLISPSGKILWTKRDSEISSKLEGAKFAYEELENNAVTDDANLYFINKYYLTCISLKDGSLRWIVSI